MCDEMGSDHQNLFHLEARWWNCGKVIRRFFELQKEDELFVLDKKSDVSHYFQDNKRVAMLEYLRGIVLQIRAEFKT
jgi:hypothetical protein